MAMAQIDKHLFGEGFFGQSLKSKKAGILANRFIVPPVTVLDTRQGYWVARKEAWLALGLKGEAGRAMRGKRIDSGKDYGDSFAHNIDGFGKKARLRYEGKEINPEELDSGTSVFDPVLCEVMYQWFNIAGGSVLDPFAGEATKGVVASMLGHPYLGIELRDWQIKENKKQAKRFGVKPVWLWGDSRRLKKLVPKSNKFDMVFTSPPYYDLEVYSDLQEDGSAMQTYEEFLEWYYHVFKQCANRLKNNRFMVVKVGGIRDQKTRAMRNFVGDSARVIMDTGLQLHNELILLSRGGSLPLRSGLFFKAGRKIARAHQVVQVFYKGDVRKIREHFSNDDFGGDWRRFQSRK
jgi:DNA modification methylase